MTKVALSVSLVSCLLQGNILVSIFGRASFTVLGSGSRAIAARDMKTIELENRQLRAKDRDS